jgi:uncharacterized membrane protein YdjX (TVP38/TMEM64 family)
VRPGKWRKIFRDADGQLDVKSLVLTIVSVFVLTALLLGGIVGAGLIGLEGQANVERLIGLAAGKSWAFPGVMAIFIAFSFTGFPQFLLIAAAVVVLGPWKGFLCAWTGTMVAAIIHFFLGRILGSPLLRRYGGMHANRLSNWLGRHGFTASAVVRIVPSAPFIVVNLAAGVSHISTLAFIGGTAVGTIPKAAVIAFLGIGLTELFGRGDPLTLFLALALFLGWLMSGLILRRHYRHSPQDAPTLPTSDMAVQKKRPSDTRL